MSQAQGAGEGARVEKSPENLESKEAKGQVPHKELSFLEHLGELRGRIIKSLLSVLLGMLIAYEFSGGVLSFLVRPLMVLMPEGRGLIATGLPETFLIHVKIALWAGVIISSPFWLYQLWSFVAPGLYRRERKAVFRLTLATVLLLICGAAFAYFVVLPIGFKFFLSFSGDNITILPVVHEYLSLVMTLLLSFGLAFELPLLLMFMASTGLIDSKKLRSFRPYAVIIIVTLAAFLTPPDVISQVLMSIPMFGLYELSIFLIKGKERALARELAGEDAEDASGEVPGSGKNNAKAQKREERLRLKREAKEKKAKEREEKAMKKQEKAKEKMEKGK
ncbi:MAG: twin-arginine translocase subunit TatC [Deltaproteobacteria bacterium]|nr:twin-arginine translocase subunit TatC [Deltaproteobacteria bacterium]